MNDEMDDSVREYFEFLFDKLNELVIEDISYSDYDQMTDWLGEIKNHVRRIEKKQYPMNPVNDHCKCGEDVRNWTGDEPFNYCPNCGQKIDWTED